MWSSALWKHTAVPVISQLKDSKSNVFYNGYQLLVSHRRSGFSSREECIKINSASEHEPYTLGEKQQKSITMNDEVKVKKMQELRLNLYFFHQRGITLPGELTIKDFENMLFLTPLKLLNYLNQTLKRNHQQKSKEEDKIETSEDRKLETENKENQSKTNELPWLSYRLFTNSLFCRIHKSSLQRQKEAYASKALVFGQKLVIDCLPSSNSDNEFQMKQVGNQIMNTLTRNRGYSRPFSMHLCNLEPESKLMLYLKHINPGFDEECAVGLYSCSYLDIFDRKRLVYVIPHAKEVLEYNPEDIYILGEVVTRDINMLLKKAAAEKIRAVSLPIEAYGHRLKRNRNSLFLHQYARVLHQVKNTRDKSYNGNFVCQENC